MVFREAPRFVLYMVLNLQTTLKVHFDLLKLPIQSSTAFEHTRHMTQ